MFGIPMPLLGVFGLEHTTMPVIFKALYIATLLASIIAYSKLIIGLNPFKLNFLIEYVLYASLVYAISLQDEVTYGHFHMYLSTDLYIGIALAAVFSKVYFDNTSNFYIALIYFILAAIVLYLLLWLLGIYIILILVLIVLFQVVYNKTIFTQIGFK